MKQTSVERIGRSQLIPSVRRTVQRGERNELRGRSRPQRSGTVARDVGVLALALLPQLACSASPGGGVSGTVRDGSGRPIAGAEVTLTTETRIFGVRVSFAAPLVMDTTTNDDGTFAVTWMHGDPDEGPALRVQKAGYAPAAERLGLGHVPVQNRVG